MKTWNEIYITNKKIDAIYAEKYSTDKEMYHKNCIGFLAELGEFFNETKCFKYWSVKKPKYDELLEEFADVFTMLMTFYNVLDEEFIIPNIQLSDENLLEVINNTYYLGTKLYDEISSELINKILINLLLIANLLDITEDEIIIAIEKKHNILYERLNDNEY